MARDRPCEVSEKGRDLWRQRIGPPVNGGDLAVEAGRPCGGAGQAWHEPPGRNIFRDHPGRQEHEANAGDRRLRNREANPDVVALAGMPKPVALFMKTAEQQGWEPTRVSPSLLADQLFAELCGSAVDGMHIVFDVALPDMPEAEETCQPPRLGRGP